MISNIMTIIEPAMQLTMIVMTGLYFAFSNTVMQALKKVSNGSEVMVEINEVILNPIFMLFFLGSAISSIYLMICTDGYTQIAAMVFLVGTTVVTMIKNVPLNNRLRDAKEGSQRSEIWDIYLKRWVFWNHVRTIAAMISGFLIVL